MSITHRFWFNKLIHLALLMLVAVLLVLFYGVSHRLLKKQYQNSIKALSDAAFKNYSYRRSADGHKVEVLQSGQSIDMTLERPVKAPFGLERLDSYRGVINEHIGKAAQLTSFYQQRKAKDLAFFQSVSPGLYRLPLASLGCSASTLMAEVSSEELSLLRSNSLDQFPDHAAALIVNASLFDNIGRAAAILPATRNNMLNRAIDLGSRFANTVPGSRTDAPLSAECRARVLDYFSRWHRQVATQVCAATNLNTVAPGDWSLNRLMAQLSDELRHDLNNIAAAETGSFWLMGRYRWWEMIFWVWFGVATMAFMKLTPHLLGFARRSIWEPRETLMVFPKFFYAPLLALALFFMAGFMGIGGVEAGELGRSSPAIIGVAFILGLFPNTSFRIIKDVCTRLFRDDLREGPPAQAKPETVTVRSATSSQNGKPLYTVDDLKRNVSGHVTSVLKSGSP